MRKSLAFFSTLTLALITGSVALADRHPNAEERAKLETALTQAGFTSWGEIELDDDKVWEVDDARHKDGQKYDLELDKTTLKIIKQDRD